MTAAIEVDEVSKKFRLFRDRPTSLKARVLSSRAKAEDFWALRDVAFDVAQGSSRSASSGTTARARRRS